MEEAYVFVCTTFPVAGAIIFVSKTYHVPAYLLFAIALLEGLCLTAWLNYRHKKGK